MKRCPKHYWFEYDETQGGCQLCEREALKAQSAGGNGGAPAYGGVGLAGAAGSIEPHAPPPESARAGLPSEPTGNASPLSAAATPPPPPRHESGFVMAPPPELTPPPVDRGSRPAPDFRPEPDSRPEPDFRAGPDLGQEPGIRSETGFRTNPETQPQSPQAQPASVPSSRAAPDPLSDEDSRILAQLTQLRENGVFTVVVIGFYAGGKTWFVNRLKHELGRWGFNLSPPPARDRERVIRTTQVEIHHARRLADDQVKGFALVDIPGERLTRLVAKDFRSVKSVIAAMDMCGALIVALPADEVLLGEDIHREAETLRGVDHVLCKRTADNPELHKFALKARELVMEAGSVEDALGSQALKSTEMERIRALGENKTEEQRQRLLRLAEENEALDMLTRVYRISEADAELSHFTQDLCFMTGLMSKLKQDGRPLDASYDFGALQAGDVDTHISSMSYARFTRPTYVAMTKADLVSHPDPLLEALIKHGRKPDIGIAFDEDPLDTVREMRPSLGSMFEQWFSNSKFDFVTAFHQHRQSDRIDYSAGHFGVTAVFDWISWAQRWDAQGRAERTALARARAIRHSRDGRRDPARDWEFMNRKMSRG